MSCHTNLVQLDPHFQLLEELEMDKRIKTKLIWANQLSVAESKECYMQVKQLGMFNLPNV